MNPLFWIGIILICFGISLWVYGAVKFQKNNELNKNLIKRKEELENNIKQLNEEHSNLKE